ncbi:MAG: alpha/beta fold hydrolase [Chloroflexi bacterium]|nr:MAG: alpha/beta fold hydrolase [Chloroflexota bacterium]TMC38317.1 MAG: alpha/beta fold hydrolase [Chloroflexota bacterium]
MRKIVQRLLKIVELIGLGAFVTLIAALIVSLRHRIDTPQPLESILPGEAHIYRSQRGHIFYKTLGDDKAPPLVLLHAPVIGASAYEMRKIIEALAQQYYVYAPDLLGFGLSDHPNINYSAGIYIDFCHEFLTQVVRRPATILTSGLSCTYAVITAKHFPEICEQLILISPLALFANERDRRRQRAALLALPLVSFFLYPIMATRLALRFALSRNATPSQGQILGADVDYLYATTHQFGAEHAPLALLTGKLSVDASHEFDTLDQRALVIWGARALHNARSIAGKHSLPEHAEIALIQDAGQFVHEEFPAMTVENIRAWSEVGKIREEKSAPESTGVVARKPITATPEHVAVEKSKAAAQSQQLNSGKTQLSTEAVGVEAYCVKCKKKTLMQKVEAVTTKNGAPALKGTCSICGTGQFRMGRI